MKHLVEVCLDGYETPEEADAAVPEFLEECCNSAGSTITSCVPVKSQAFVFLDKNDILQPDDKVRPLFFWRDLGSFGPGPDPYEEDAKGKHWRELRDVLPAWIGKTLLDLHNFAYTDEDEPVAYIARYEVMRAV